VVSVVCTWSDFPLNSVARILAKSHGETLEYDTDGGSAVFV
jgi:hypothetical protein